MSRERDPWEAIDKLAAQVAALAEAFQAATELPRAQHRAETHRLTPEMVRRRKFLTTRLRPGYSEEDVDAFLDQVEAELATLIIERDQARAEAAALREPT